jgi:hypothetical protein
LDTSKKAFFLLRYCIDKNYGGFLSIWDRIFGTFEEERKVLLVLFMRNERYFWCFSGGA